MTVMTDGGGSTRWCYDIRGREVRKRRRISGDATAYDIQHAYEPADRVTSLTYPDGERITNSYDDLQQGNLDGDGSITILDLSAMASNFGRSVASNCKVE